MTPTDGAQAAELIDHYDHRSVDCMVTFMENVTDDIPRLITALRRVLDATYQLDDGTEYEHNGHGPNEGEPECPGCWAATIRQAIADNLKDPS